MARPGGLPGARRWSRPRGCWSSSIPTSRSGCRGRSSSRRPPDPPAARRRRPATRSTNWTSRPGWSTRWPRCRCRSRSSTRAAGRWKCRSSSRLPYDGAIDQMTLHGRRQGVSRPSCSTPRKPGGLYEDIVRKNRTRPCWNGWARACSRRACFPVPAGAKRTVSLRYSQLCRKQEGLTDFLFPLSTAKYTSEAVEKVAIPRDDREPGGDQERLQPDARGRDQAARRAARRRSRTRPRTRCRRAISACSTTSARARSSTRVLSYRPDDERRRLLPAAGQPGDQGRRRRSRPPKTVVFVVDRSGSMSGKKIEQVRGGAEVRAEQPPRGRPVQHRRLRQRGRVVPARVAAVRRRDPQGGAGLRRGPLRRRQHEHRRGAADGAGPAAGLAAGRTTCSS